MDDLFKGLTPEDTTLLERVRDEFFKDSPIAIDTVKHSTQWLDERGKLVLGVWAGPRAKTDNLLHEMAHFVEIDQPRMGMCAWGLRLPKMHYMPGQYGGHSWCEPKTMQISARELRVMALQHHLHLHLGIEPWREKVGALMKWFPDRYNVPGYRQGAANRWVLAQYDRLIKAPRYSLAAFREEWSRRNEVLRVRYARGGRRAARLKLAV